MESGSSCNKDESKLDSSSLSNAAAVSINEKGGHTDDAHHNYSPGEDLFSQHQGFWYVPNLLQTVKSVQEHFRAEPGDILLSSFPKSGTTWLKSLAFAIATRNQYDCNTCVTANENSNKNPLLTMSSHDCVPFIEQDTKLVQVNLEYPRFGEHQLHRLLATHIPYTSLPTSLMVVGSKSNSCKIIYICCDPKDVLVSFWHFRWKMLDPISLDDMFEFFCQGKINYGSYWDHVLTYWKESIEYPEKVMFIKYEDLKSNTSSYVKKIAEFMGCPFSLEEEQTGEVEKVVTLCSFENLSSLEVNKSGKRHLSLKKGAPLDNNVMFRKGKTGDGKNYLSPQMKERLDLITSQKFEGSGISFN